MFELQICSLVEFRCIEYEEHAWFNMGRILKTWNLAEDIPVTT